jgi:hypothetical protein
VHCGTRRAVAGPQGQVSKTQWGGARHARGLARARLTNGAALKEGRGQGARGPSLRCRNEGPGGGTFRNHTCRGGSGADREG